VLSPASIRPPFPHEQILSGVGACID
jgi:hypothetical protein